ncbi:MAG: PIG-L deacetylase family protein [Bacteroidota bacterium]|jgi:LmbE family N-acetylglucosaminyl deacetylase
MMITKKTPWVAVIVAHPDDETLWAGGTILSKPAWRWFVLSLCRGSDPDRAPRFFNALKTLGAEGRMGDLDDGPEQIPLEKNQIMDAIQQSLPDREFDLLITHSPAGEYTRHRRHEETGKAVMSLWQEGKVQTHELWMFAYEDGKKSYRPQPIRTAPLYQALPDRIWKQKYDLITKTYGFPENGFEAETTPRAEAFWQFIDPSDAQQWLMERKFQSV